MNPPRATPLAYMDFLLASQGVVSATEAARVQPELPCAPAHDSITRLLHRLDTDSQPLWDEVAPLLRPAEGMLVLDDSVLDKPYARHMALVGWFYSGKHRRVVKGIDLLTLLWTDGDVALPCDYRIVDPAEAQPKVKGVAKAQTKNDLFCALLKVAHGRGLRPRRVVFDAWYSGKENLKAIRELGWTFLTQVRSNRRVNLDRQGNRAISELPISAAGTVVHLEGFGLIKAFRIVARNGDREHWITNDLGMGEQTRLSESEQAWGIEEYHRGLKQHCGVEGCQARAGDAQRNHIGMAIRVFVRLEWHRFTTGLSWFEAKARIIREAIRAFLARPLYRLTVDPCPPTA